MEPWRRELYEKELYHYGVKGMKWGEHKFADALSELYKRRISGEYYKSGSNYFSLGQANGRRKVLQAMGAKGAARGEAQNVGNAQHNYYNRTLAGAIEKKRTIGKLNAKKRLNDFKQSRASDAADNKKARKESKNWSTSDKLIYSYNNAQSFAYDVIKLSGSKKLSSLYDKHLERQEAADNPVVYRTLRGIGNTYDKAKRSLSKKKK